MLAPAMDGHARRLQGDHVVVVLMENGQIFLHGAKVHGKSDATCQVHPGSLNGKNMQLSCRFMSTKAYLNQSNQT